MSLFAKQAEFLKAFQSQQYRFLLYGGAVGGGKSILQIGILHQMAMDYPGTRWAIVRKNLKTLKRTSIPSYKKVLALNVDEEQIRINNSDYIAFYPNGSEILFVEADKSKDPDFDKLKGLELTGALIEEANEIDESAFSILKTRIGRWENERHGIRPFIMLNCNPAKNWVKSTFYDPWVEQRLDPLHYYLPALPTDNPHNSDDYLALLDSLPETERQRFKLGNWEYSDDPNQLISYIAIKEVFSDQKFDSLASIQDQTIYLGVDVARYGDDRSVLAYFVGNVLCKFEEFVKKSTTEIARIVEDRMRLYKILDRNIGIDVVGLGAGTVDTLNDLKIFPMTFNSGESPSEKGPNPYMCYKNKRAEAHWLFREDIINKDIEVVQHPQFIKEATNINYKVTEKVIQIESKEAFKARMDFSPDYLDAAKIANYVRRRSVVSFKKIAKINRLIEKPLSKGVEY